MNKITALEQTIFNLENDVYEYDWMQINSCNCGVLARTLLGGKLPLDCGFHDSPHQDPLKMGAFARNAYCLTTNLPLPEVFKALRDAGFSHQELLELENLANGNICKKAGIEHLVIQACNEMVCGYRDDKKTLISYLKAWVSILKEEGQEGKAQEKDTIVEAKPEIRERIKYVSVPESITKQTEQLILQ